MKETFQRIYFQYYQTLCRFAQFYVTEATAAEDTVQQVFMRLWEKEVDFNQIDNVQSYLFTSIKNEVLNEKRKQILLHEIQEEDKTVEASVLDDIAGKELAIQLELLVAQMPPKRQYIFRLSRENNMTYKEIADQLDIAPKTVENQIGKALKFLKENISN